jgi:hypothetical protein
MLILLDLDSPRSDIDAIKQKIISRKCNPHEIPGETNLAIGITGPTHTLITSNFFKFLK